MQKAPLIFNFALIRIQNLLSNIIFFYNYKYNFFVEKYYNKGIGFLLERCDTTAIDK